MKFSLFRSGWVPRVGAAVAYAVLAFGFVGLVTRPAPAPQEAVIADHSTAPTASAGVAVRVMIDSVQPVAEWTVRNAGEIIIPRTAAATYWEAEFRSAVVDLSVLTTPTGDAGPNALRIRLESGTQREDLTFWCPGDCAIAIGPDDFPASQGRDSTP